MKWSGVGTLPDFNEFTGLIEYQSQSQGYDTTATHIEFANGCQVERKLFDDDQYNVFNQRPAALGASAARTREKHAARLLNMAFSNDTYFYNNTEGVALCSNSHTTTSGASTASGFDNLGTASMTAVAVATGRIQMVGFRGDQAERISVIPNQLWYPPDLYEKAYEIINASGKVDTALNNPNVHEGKYTGHEWNFLTDSNNWFMIDSRTSARMFHWIDRIALEFGMIEDFDTLIAKFRAYMRYSIAWTDWRCICGFQVS
ncbi:hypothetical protein AMJ82_08935 [candidate division TA06 bacterium SM23_40]|uniref:Uncharacterized protein n=1 Tax=candidate division TA06 bacterium SM23_40 TaxID=1703774 RepID=A0A0S8G6H0_UNCT6|nr:MAG: hypothetical protein AMJ82_08935 [candidate division TA06 bacterium SM23_40]